MSPFTPPDPFYLPPPYINWCMFQKKGVVRFMVLRTETPIMYWVRMQDMKMARMYQKLVLGMAMQFAKAESTKQL